MVYQVQESRFAQLEPSLEYLLKTRFRLTLTDPMIDVKPLSSIQSLARAT